MEEKIEIRPKEGEFDIPGFPLYTIDRELVVRSYRSAGNPYYIKKRKNHHFGYEYHLSRYEGKVNKTYTFAPIRIYLCALAGRCPIGNKMVTFGISNDGQPDPVLLANIEKESKRRYKEISTPKEQQAETADEYTKNLSAIRQANKSGDWNKVAEKMYECREFVTGLMEYKYRIDKREAEEYFSQGLMSALRKVMEAGYVVANIRGFLMSETVCAFARRKK